MADADNSRYSLRGTAGDAQTNGPLHLGDELLVVSRCIVSRVDEHLNAEHLLIRNHTLEATVAFIVENGDRAQLKKLGTLSPAQVDQLTGADRLL